MLKELISLGLAEKEAHVYLALTDLGETTIGPLERKLGIHKQIVYGLLQRLQTKDLVSTTVRNGKKTFAITDPEAFHRHIQTQKSVADSLVPKIFARQGMERQVNELKIYQNTSGIQSFLMRTLKLMPVRSEMNIIGAGGEAFLDIARERYFFDRYENLRIHKKISHSMVMYENQRNTDPVYLKRRYVNVRFLPESYQQPIATHVWPDRISILLFGENPQIVEIKSNKIREGFQNYFKMLWKIAKE